MSVPLQITYRHVAATAALDALIRARASVLDGDRDQILHCHVFVERERRHHRQDANTYHVRINLVLPRDEIVVSREPTLHPALQDGGEAYVIADSEVQREHAHVDVAVRDAFDLARRRLRERE